MTNGISAIAVKEITISVKDRAEYESLPISKLAFTEATYNELRKEVTFKTNTTGPSESWRLVHDGKTVIMLEQIRGYTTTIWTIFEAETKAKCLEEVKKLNLEVPDFTREVQKL